MPALPQDVQRRFASVAEAEERQRQVDEQTAENDREHTIQDEDTEVRDSNNTTRVSNAIAPFSNANVRAEFDSSRVGFELVSSWSELVRVGLRVSLHTRPSLTKHALTRALFRVGHLRGLRALPLQEGPAAPGRRGRDHLALLRRAAAHHLPGASTSGLLSGVTDTHP